MMRRPAAPSIAALLAVLTVGVVVGISFVAQPVKFSAADVALAQQVRIGSVIFHASHKVQLALLFATVLALLLTRPLVLPLALPSALAAAAAHRRAHALGPFAGLAVAGAALALQWLWLMPLLDERVAALSSGPAPLPQAWLHLAYAALEIGKLFGLLALAWQALSTDRQQADDDPKLTAFAAPRGAQSAWVGPAPAEPSAPIGALAPSAAHGTCATVRHGFVVPNASDVVACCGHSRPGRGRRDHGVLRPEPPRRGGSSPGGVGVGCGA